MLSKDKPKKVFRTFRIEPEIDAKLTELAEITGEAKTKIVEDALEHYLGGGIKRNLQKQSAKILKIAESL